MTVAAIGLLLASATLQAQQPPTLTPEALFERIAPSVWTVRTQDSEGRPLGQGSAVVIAPGRLITNCHVLRRAASFAVARENVAYGATLEHPDVERDLCQIKVANFTAPPVAIAPPDSLRVGARVYAIGAPRGLETTISDGLLSGIRRNERSGFEALQITVPISPGSSGGGLFDAQGRLVGITTFQLRDAQSLNFALPAAWIAEVPERAQAAIAARNAPPPAVANAGAAAKPTGDRVFEYRLNDRFTGNSQTVVYRLDRVDGERMIFNNGNRVERVGGGVIENKQALGGEFDTMMPPGGWISAKPEAGSTWRLNYTSGMGDDQFQIEFNARVAETSTMRVASRDLQIVRVEFKGYARRRMYSFAYTANAWYAPDLARVVRFDAKANGGHGVGRVNIDEVLELVDIRSE